MLWIILAFFTLLLFGYVIDVYSNRHPLDQNEIKILAEKRRRDRAIEDFKFCTLQRVASPEEKKGMKGKGHFVRCDMDYFITPSRIAGLLKYKKHEWIVIAFIINKKVKTLWWNKGPDSTTVRSFLSDHELNKALNTFEPDTLAFFHNHPNPDPSRYRANLPSDADLNSASLYHRKLGTKGITLIDFISERGVPYLYYAGFHDSVVPVDPIMSGISQINGSGILKNYSLRKELRQTTKGEQIPGGKVGGSHRAAS